MPENFTFTAGNGKDYSLPIVPLSPLMRKYRKLGNVDFMFSILEEIGPADISEAIDSTKMADLDSMFTDYMQGLTRGESSSSPTS